MNDDLTNPHITELEHLRLSLAETTKLFDEVESKLQSRSTRISIRHLMDKGANFTKYIPGDSAKIHQSPVRNPRPEDVEDRFAVLVASCMSKKLDGG